MGIVSRRDVLRVFLRSDGDLHADVAHLLELVGVTPGDRRIQVRAGVVHLSGELPYQRLAEVIGTLTRQIDGVVDVVNRLTYASNDTGGAEPHAS